MARSAIIVRIANLWGAALLGIGVCTAAMAGGQTESAAANEAAILLARADSGIKHSDHAQFSSLLDQLDTLKDGLTEDQLWKYRYLRGWQATYLGDYDRARAILNEVRDHASNNALRFRASATLLNVLGYSHRYQEAFVQLNQLQDQLPTMADEASRYQGLGEAALLLIAAGQYAQATEYADQMLAHIPAGDSACKALYIKLHARYRAGEITDVNDPMLTQGLDACIRSHQYAFTNSLRSDMAGLQLHHGNAAEAVALLRHGMGDAMRDQYEPVLVQFHALLARAYLRQGKLDQAEENAMQAINTPLMPRVAEPLSAAYEVLYRIAESRDDFRAALEYHEKYMTANKAYLDDVSAASLAYQIVNQQVQTNRQHVAALNKQNVILKLKQALDRKAVENGRLYIVLLLTVIGFVVFWVYRLKRSQLRFMWLSRQDSLTGICNRKHLIDSAQRLIHLAEKTGKPVALLLIDLDHFKQINDTHGHNVGDQVLKRVVEACLPLLGVRDVFGRLGGEEFAMLLPDVRHAQALQRAEQVRQAIANTSVGDPVEGIPVSASLGVVTTEDSGYQFRQMLIDADHALYKAKRDGRDRVVGSREEGANVLPFPPGEKKAMG